MSIPNPQKTGLEKTCPRPPASHALFYVPPNPCLNSGRMGRLPLLSPSPRERGSQERDEGKGSGKAERECSSMQIPHQMLYTLFHQIPPQLPGRHHHRHGTEGAGVASEAEGLSPGMANSSAWAHVGSAGQWSLSTAFNLGRCLSLGPLGPHKGGWYSPPRPGLLAVPCTWHPVGTHNCYCLKTNAQFPFY